MSYWHVAKKQSEEYVIIRHKIPKFNGFVSGVRFREGYGVVVKNSKVYGMLKRLPLLKNSEEYPLTHLRQLKFIPRDREIEIIYGKDVYNNYLVAKQQLEQQETVEQKEEENRIHLEESDLCKFRTKTGDYCKMEAFEHSPSHYCKRHLLDDELAKEVTKMYVPSLLSKKERKQYRLDLIAKLEKIKPNK